MLKKISAKDGSVDEVVLWLGLSFGVIIIGIWFISFVGEQTVQDQNLVFTSLSFVTSHVQLACDVVEVNISTVRFQSLNGGVITFSSSQVCIEGPNIISLCENIICRDSVVRESSFNLSSNNLLSIIKKEGEQINVSIS